MKGFVNNIEKETGDNDFFRKVIFTAEHSQLVLLCLKSLIRMHWKLRGWQLPKNFKIRELVLSLFWMVLKKLAGNIKFAKLKLYLKKIRTLYTPGPETFTQNLDLFQ